MDFLDRITEIVQTNKKSSQESNNGGWIGALVAGILVMIITAVFGFIAWKRGQERTKLLHEEAVRLEDLHQAELDASLAPHDEARATALQQVAQAQEAMAALEVERLRLEDEHREIRERIDSVVSWDDVDVLLGRTSARPAQ